MIDLLYVPPVSIALFRGHAKREPSAGVFRSKSASFRQFQWRGESLGEARSAVEFVENRPLHFCHQSKQIKKRTRLRDLLLNPFSRLAIKDSPYFTALSIKIFLR